MDKSGKLVDDFRFVALAYAYELRHNEQILATGRVTTDTEVEVATSCGSPASSGGSRSYLDRRRTTSSPRAVTERRTLEVRLAATTRPAECRAL